MFLQPAGDLVFNANPVDGGNAGWIYTLSNQWRSFGTVSLSSDISSFTLNLQSVDSSGDSICTLDTISVKFNLNDAPSVSVAETTTQYNYQVCDGTTVVLDFDYYGEQTSISAADITWSPENPGFDPAIELTAADWKLFIRSGFCRKMSSIPGIELLNIVLVI